MADARAAAWDAASDAALYASGHTMADAWSAAWDAMAKTIGNWLDEIEDEKE